jgi:hypothetical protein
MSDTRALGPLRGSHVGSRGSTTTVFGGGLWEAMHGEMGGFYEVRKQGAPNRTQYRLFCLLDNAEPAELRRRGLPGPAIVVLTGMSKPWMTAFGAGDYQAVRALGDDYRATLPRRIAQ